MTILRIHELTDTDIRHLGNNTAGEVAIDRKPVYTRPDGTSDDDHTPLAFILPQPNDAND